MPENQLKQYTSEYLTARQQFLQVLDLLEDVFLRGAAVSGEGIDFDSPQSVGVLSLFSGLQPRLTATLISRAEKIRKLLPELISAMELCEAQLSNMVEFTMKDLPLKSELAWDCLQAYKLVGGVLERDLVLHRKLLKLRPFDPSISDLLESWRSKSLSQKDIQTILTRGKK